MSKIEIITQEKVIVAQCFRNNFGALHVLKSPNIVDMLKQIFDDSFSA